MKAASVHACRNMNRYPRNNLRAYLENIGKNGYNSYWIILCCQLAGGIKMAISYNKMWKLLVDKKMSKADLRKAANIAPNTMTKLRRDEPVNLANLSGHHI